MPVATPDQYAEMLDTAKKGGFAFPAVNVSSSSTINSVLQGLSEAGSDGIIQVTTGGADYFAGQTVKARAPRSPRTTRSRSPCTPTTARRRRCPAS
jgi:fructose-bisphosphate aldolase, class II